MEEVHLWRGSAEQRALRSRLGNLSRFAYFNRQLDYPDWSGQAVLDFGGNIGGLLRGSNRAIRPEDYYCADVLQEAMTEGRSSFPQAHWIHFNRYNCSFNPEGVKDLPIPDMGIEFGMILAYSVFTHTTREEMKELVEQLQARLAPGGALAFTFIDPHYTTWPETYQGNNLKWRLERARQLNPNLDIDGLLEQSRGAAWCALVDGTELFVNGNGEWNNKAVAQTCITYNVFYTVEFLQREFPLATIRPPVNGEMHHCCIIRRQG
ncbi:MAG: methyltransferase domain-containing protein [Pyrinomonadaceae bacterium]|nr:methyltransferase domain-containing protein [Pyrinomonadaceae bacterium]